jgi:isopenicillin N synthase-like dioxygenase
LLDGNFDSPIAKEAIKKIDDACRNVGFFSIINHGVKKDLIKETLAKIKEFFYLSPEKKLECAAKKWNPKSTNSYRGYFPSTVHGK